MGNGVFPKAGEIGGRRSLDFALAATAKRDNRH
jgi:hypothetical protein